MTQTGLRPSSGARYVLERDEAGEGATPLVYRGFVHLPDADVPLEVRIAWPGAPPEPPGSPAPAAQALPGDKATATATAAAAAVPQGGPSAAELERVAAALVKSAVRSALSNERPPPRKVVRWRG